MSHRNFKIGERVGINLDFDKNYKYVEVGTITGIATKSGHIITYIITLNRLNYKIENLSNYNCGERKWSTVCATGYQLVSELDCLH